MAARYKIIRNVGHVDYQGARLWCNLVLIELAPLVLADKPQEHRQIRGLSWGGLPVFTVWIPPTGAIGLTADRGGQQVLLSHDGGRYNLDAGVRIEIGSIFLGVVADDFRQPVVVEDWPGDVPPFGDEVDALIFPYAGGQNYPRPVWTALPHVNRLV